MIPLLKAEQDQQAELQSAESLVVFADDWGRHPSSCQHLIMRLREDCRVLWVNTIGTRSPKANAFTLFRGIEKLKSWANHFRQESETMWVLDCPMLPWVGNSLARRMNRELMTRLIKRCMRRANISAPIVVSTLPHVSWLLGDIGEKGLVYYCTDDYSNWPGAERESLLAAERHLQDRSDLVLAVSDQLMKRNQDYSCHYFPHAVDYDHFASAGHVKQCEELDAYKHPRIGFFGLVYEKLDFEMLTSIAQDNPQASLIMMGPVDYCPERFSNLNNVSLVGRVPYEELPTWLAGMDLLLMPYVEDDMILQSSPLKLKECLATGIPTVCVNIPEAKKYEPHLSVAQNQQHFLQLVKHLLSSPDPVQHRDARRERVQAETWDKRAQELKSLLESELFQK